MTSNNGKTEPTSGNHGGNQDNQLGSQEELGNPGGSRMRTGNDGCKRRRRRMLISDDEDDNNPAESVLL